MYCERFMEFLIDVEAQLPTRRFFNAILEDSHLVCLSYLSNVVKKPEGKLFKEVIRQNLFTMASFVIKPFPHTENLQQTNSKTSKHKYKKYL